VEEAVEVVSVAGVVKGTGRRLVREGVEAGVEGRVESSTRKQVLKEGGKADVSRGISNATRLSPAEQATATRLQQKLGRPLKESPHVGAEYVDDLGRTYDALGDPAASRFWDEQAFTRSIDAHLLKSNDFTVIDMTGFTAEQAQTVAAYVDALTSDQQRKIIRIGF
jgi:hypothetical protein